MLGYCIIPNEEVTQEMARASHCTSPEYMRHNKTNTIAIWDGEKPKCLFPYPEITDIKTELAKPEWQPVDEEAK